MRLASFVVAVTVFTACGDDDPIAPDAATPPPDSDPGIDIDAVPTGCVTDRVTADRPDDQGFDQIRVLYVVPADGVDNAHDTSGKICNSVRSFATWFHTQADAYLRLDTQGGLIDIGFVRLIKSDAEMRGTDPNNTSIATGTAFVRERIERELIAMGLIASNKLYAVYYDGSSTYACGGGAYPPLIKERVGAMYLQGFPPGSSQVCGSSRPWGVPTLAPNYVDYGMLHELVHSLGFVPDASPNEHTGGHVFDAAASQPNRDLMYSPRTGQDPGWAIDTGLLLDLNRDDYFMTATTLDLAASSLLSPLPANARRPVGW